MRSFKERLTNDAVDNSWTIKSITDETKQFDANWLDGLRILENSKLFNHLDISTLALEFGSKLWIRRGCIHIFENYKKLAWY